MIRSLLRYASFLLATELSYGDGAALDEDVGFVTRRSAEKQGQWLARRCQRRQMDSTLSLEQKHFTQLFLTPILNSVMTGTGLD